VDACYNVLNELVSGKTILIRIHGQAAGQAAGDVSLNFRQNYIGLKIDGAPDNIIMFVPKGNVLTVGAAVCRRRRGRRNSMENRL
jgi:hypothetical protein